MIAKLPLFILVLLCWSNPHGLGQTPPPSSDPLDREAALVWPYSPITPHGYRFSGEGTLQILEAAGEYCREKGVEFRSALPALWEDRSLLFAGKLPRRSGERDEKWGILFKDNPSPGEGPWSLSLVVLHPKGTNLKSMPLEQAWNYSPKIVSFVSKKMIAYGIVTWLENEGPDLGVVVLDQGRPYAAIHPWVWQSVSKYRVRATGITKLWEKSGEIHDVNWRMGDILQSFSVNGGRPRLILAEPDAPAIAMKGADAANLTPTGELKREVALVAPYARGSLAQAAEEKVPRPTQSILLEAAGRYCLATGAAKGGPMGNLPRIAAIHGVLTVCPLDPKPDTERQKWAIVYRNGQQPGDGAFRLSAIIFEPGDPPKPGEDAGGRPPPPTVHALTCRGLRARESVAWLEDEGHDSGFVVLDQGKPSETHPWYHQTVAQFVVTEDGLRRLWKKTSELHAIDYVPLTEMIRQAKDGRQPSVKLALPPSPKG